VCGGAEAFAATTAPVIVWERTALQLHRLSGIKRFCFFSQEKRSRPFLVTFSGEAEKVTAATRSGTSARPPAPAVNKHNLRGEYKPKIINAPASGKPSRRKSEILR
jgi:hypothetical protein